MKKKQAHRRVETKMPVDDSTVYLLIFADSPVYFVHGAYSSEKKLFGELGRLAKLDENKLTKAQRRANAKAMGINKRMVKKSKKSDIQMYRTLHCGKAPYKDPMDRYSIREIVVT